LKDKPETVEKVPGACPQGRFFAVSTVSPLDFPGNRGVILESIVEKSD
jgi:hypothetical protein